MKMSNQKNQELIDMRNSYKDMEPQFVTKASNIGRTFTNVNTNTSIKSEYTIDDYGYYRQYESVPKNIEGRIALSMKAYDKVGIIHKAIDMMADFTCKGIKILHPVPSQERFFQEWWSYVKGYQISERFANYCYRMGNVVVNRTYGKVPVKIERKWTSSRGDVIVREPETQSRRIPLRYSFLNPLSIEVLSPEISSFIGKNMYMLRITTSLKTALARLKSQYPNVSEQEIFSILPTYILDAIKTGKNLIPIDSENISIYHYRKDDWNSWADPMISCILDDLIALEKLQLSDISALDGAISNIRLWKLGKMDGDNPALWLIPPKAIMEKLKNMLANNVGGGTMDLVWGPDIEFKEVSTNVHNFLGMNKYEPTLIKIYEGLGLPYMPTTGTGMTNNFILMQTFIERLEYGRKVLLDFWNKELKIIQKAMGYAKPAEIVFDNLNIGDDTSYKQVILGLLDRDIISVDSALESFKFSKLEKGKIMREYKMRKSGKLITKASPYHDPMIEDNLKKIILQRGGVAPSEVGLNLLPKKEGELSPNQQQEETQIKLAKISSEDKLLQRKFSQTNQNGRPKGKNDTSKRKTKRPPLAKSDVNFVNNFIWGVEAQKKISDFVTPIFLESVYKKPNVRSLSTAEFNELEEYKFLLFSNLIPGTEVSEDKIREVIDSSPKMNQSVLYAAKALAATFITGNGNKEPTIEQLKQIQSSALALVYEPEVTDQKTISEFDV